ncbi:hypothetical protein EE612_036480 [Oryza sativa]|nr:hypothetical protein EE612_036480 [Oryza sativa]
MDDSESCYYLGLGEFAQVGRREALPAAAQLRLPGALHVVAVNRGEERRCHRVLEPRFRRACRPS